MAERPAIGIDLGTTFSCVAVFQRGKVKIVRNDQGNRTTPSYVAFTDAERITGDAAKDQAALNPKNTVFDAKRLIGRRFDDPCLQGDLKHWPFEVVNVAGKAKIQVEFKGERKSFYPEEISSMVLTKMRETAETYLGQPVRDAVITVPAYFDDSQRQATRNAGFIAGLNVLRVINEPTAAAIAYGLDKREVTSGVKNVLIYDLGGGTLDVSILSIRDGVFEVKATAGDTHLGGEDFDSIMVEHFVEEFRRKHRKDMSKNTRALRRLRTACERAKRTLSVITQTSIEIDSLFEGIDFRLAISRNRFEQLCFDSFRLTLESVGRALKDAKMDKVDIHDVVLVGGSTRIPCIQKLLQDFFDGKKLDRSIDPDEAVAHGAAIQAAILNCDDSEGVKGLVLVDVTPLSLGIELNGGGMATVIPRNSKVPCRMTRKITTIADNQTTGILAVFQGERAMAKDNLKLGFFEITAIPPAPRGVPSIKVTFDIDADGVLKVSAVEKSSGKENRITITKHEGTVSKDEIQRMVAEAEVYHEEDEERKKKLAAKNALEYFCFSLERSFGTDYAKTKQNVSESERESVLQRVKETLEWLDTDQLADIEEYKKRQNDLEGNCKPITQKSRK